jgi:hypothetical protein
VDVQTSPDRLGLQSYPEPQRRPPLRLPSTRALPFHRQRPVDDESKALEARPPSLPSEWPLLPLPKATCAKASFRWSHPTKLCVVERAWLSGDKGTATWRLRRHLQFPGTACLRGLTGAWSVSRSAPCNAFFAPQAGRSSRRAGGTCGAANREKNYFFSRATASSKCTINSL